jgi:hypothetical protein
VSISAMGSVIMANRPSKTVAGNAQSTRQTSRNHWRRHGGQNIQ